LKALELRLSPSQGTHLLDQLFSPLPLLFQFALEPEPRFGRYCGGIALPYEGVVLP
jgi:hypothetical protein